MKVDVLLVLVFFILIIGVILIGNILLQRLVKKGKSFQQIKIIVWNYFVISILTLSVSLPLVRYLINKY